MFETDANSLKELCPRCRAGRLKSWKELNSDEKFIAERLPASAAFPPAERRRHLFCPRCRFEIKPTEEKV